MRSAVRAVTDLLLLDASYDIRYLALTTAIVFLKRHPKMCTKIIKCVRCSRASSMLTLLQSPSVHSYDIVVEPEGK